MLGLIAAEIRLAPDWTAFVQLGVFLSVLLVLYVFVFRPTLRIIDRRKAFTADARAEGDRLRAEGDRLEAERTSGLTGALRDAEAERANLIAKARAEAESLVAKARAEAHAAMSSAEAAAKKAGGASEADVMKSAEALARDIASSITSTPSAGSKR